jgi:predicted ATPase
MLDMIHQFAQRQLAERGEVEMLRRWHAAYNLTLAEQAEAQLTGARQESWLKRLESDLHNLRAALKWSVEQGEAEIAVRLSGSLWRFWYIHGYLSEGRRLLSAAAMPHLSPISRRRARLSASSGFASA